MFPEYKSLNKNPWNKIILTGRQHYIAHWILAKAFGGKMWFALHVMLHGKNKKHNNIKFSKFYELIRKRHSNEMKGYIVNKNGKRKRIKTNELNDYLINGWKQGSGFSNFKKGFILINNGFKEKWIKKENYYIFKKQGFIKGKIKNKGNKIRISKGIEERIIPIENFNSWKNKGYKKGISNNRKNLITINNGVNAKRVKQEDVSIWLKENYSIGALPRGKSPIKGYITINKNGKEKKVDKENLSYWLLKGWKQGRIIKGQNAHNKGKIWVTNGKNNKCINIEQLQAMKEKGYVRGHTQSTPRIHNNTKGKICVTNGYKNKMINPNELSIWNEKGYLKGKTINKNKN